MRNWPYAAALLSDAEKSRVAGRFAVAPMPAAPEGRPTAALGGAQLAINANSDDPEAAWAVIAYLTHAERMRARAHAIGQYPPRPSLYEGDALAGALAVAPSQALAIIEGARPRPVTPRYSELSEILQIRLHECLTGGPEPEAALRMAADEMRRRLERR